MRIEQATLDKIQSIASIASAVAIPIVIAIVGWWVQSSMSNESIKKDYVQMAIGILNSPERQKDEEMRKWAVAILNENAPIPFSQDLKDKLEQGYVFVAPAFPTPPEVLMKPPVKLEPLPEKETITVDEMLISTVENYGRCHENALTLEYLQKWLVDAKAIHDKHFPQPAKPNARSNAGEP